mmetsp:Transcript_8492/g.14279  ORF Transcript_8492/g.14279 Transcript_8492/m.14279 type:complete len:310 (+) Transcript_8492:1634-2563(+)
MIEALKQLELTVSNPNLSSEKAGSLQDLLCGLVQVVLIRIGDLVMAPLAENIIQVIISIFKQAQKVTESGLIAFQGLVVGAGDKIKINEIGNYIKYALESKENECTKLACGIISDLSGSMGENISEYLDDFVPCLHNILGDQQLERTIKLPALRALADLCMYCGEKFNNKFLEKTLQILSLAARTSTQSAGSVQADDTDTIKFLKDLREEIIDQYITILVSAQESNYKGAFEQYVMGIFDFLEETVKIQGFTDLNFLRMVISLIGDLATAYPDKEGMKARATQGWVEQAILSLQQSNDHTNKEYANYSL